MLAGKCLLGNVSAEVLSRTRSVRFAHTAHASLMGAYAPKRSANRALSWGDGAERTLYVTKLVTYRALCQCLTLFIVNAQSEHLFDCCA